MTASSIRTTILLGGFLTNKLHLSEKFLKLIVVFAIICIVSVFVFLIVSKNTKYTAQESTSSYVNDGYTINTNLITRLKAGGDYATMSGDYILWTTVIPQECYGKGGIDHIYSISSKKEIAQIPHRCDFGSRIDKNYILYGNFDNNAYLYDINTGQSQTIIEDSVKHFAKIDIYNNSVYWVIDVGTIREIHKYDIGTKESSLLFQYNPDSTLPSPYNTELEDLKAYNGYLVSSLRDKNSDMFYILFNLSTKEIKYNSANISLGDYQKIQLDSFGRYYGDGIVTPNSPLCVFTDIVASKWVHVNKDSQKWRWCESLERPQGNKVIWKTYDEVGYELGYYNLYLSDISAPSSSGSTGNNSANNGSTNNKSTTRNRTTPTPTSTVQTAKPTFTTGSATIRSTNGDVKEVTDLTTPMTIKNGEMLSFTLTTTPEATVAVTIQSDPITLDPITADADGKAIVGIDTSSINLPDGEHTISAVVTDKNGVSSDSAEIAKFSLTGSETTTINDTSFWTTLNIVLISVVVLIIAGLAGFLIYRHKKYGYWFRKLKKPQDAIV